MSDWIPIEAEPKPLTFLQKRIIELQQRGMPNSLICQQLHIRSDHLTEEIYEIRKREAIMAGKLTNQQRAAIYAAYKDGVPQKDLAEQYGVSVQAISQLITKLNKAEHEIMQETAAEQKQQKVATIKDLAEQYGVGRPAPVPPEKIAEVKAEKAEEKFANAEPEKLPGVVCRAIDAGFHDLADEIDKRRNRIEELESEIAEFEKDIDALRKWREAHP